jgi:hypothetical protein
MTDFKEEAYVLEKIEISEDEDEGFEYKEIKETEDDDLDEIALDSVVEDDDDLNDFTALKNKTEQKRIEAMKKTGNGVTVEE